MALNVRDGERMQRNRQFLSSSSATQCGKMQTLATLLAGWKRAKAKVLLFSYSTQAMMG